MLCLGHRFGTSCYKRTKFPHNTPCWNKYQLCARCSKNPLTEAYRLTKNIIST